MIRHACSDVPGLFRLFVYGTLKRGYWNHEAYCRSAVSVEEATVRGRLYELPSGIPVLEVPSEDILSVGTDDPVADIQTQESISVASLSRDLSDWHAIHGEIITFSNPELCVPPIDRLESFRPGRSSLYHRVLVPAVTQAHVVVTAWCYVAPLHALLSATATGNCQWP
ncbi:MAG: gamma-glutamylcyclotransferase [Armatimonadetes bacterium]|nr:gamma-glutamylcyclotransferase [Armatimonadota bacterium]